MVENEIKDILEQFDIDGELIDNPTSKTNGNINKTFIATYKMNNGEIKQFIFQKINTTVFKEPYKLMENIENVTNYIEKKSKISGDVEHPCLRVIPTKKHKALATVLDKNGEKQYYRAYNCIENSISYDVTTDENVIFNAGKAFGHFQKLLSDFPIETLEETIQDFHNTPKRYANFIKDVRLDVCDRVDEVSKEITFVIKNSACVSTITDLMEKGKIPVRVTHNDTKINNVMMDKDTGKYLTVIDLDTVMPGSFLYDFGDGVRSACANAIEDEVDLSKVYIRLDLFEVFTDGYLSEMASYLTDDEVCNLVDAIEIITFELGLRFLNDYINGDTYFKVNYDKHNLVRARNQFKLLSDIKNKKSYMEDYVMNRYRFYKKIENVSSKKLELKH